MARERLDERIAPPSPPPGGLDALLEEPPQSVVLALSAVGLLAAGIAVVAPAMSGHPIPVAASVLLLAVVWASYCGGTAVGLGAALVVTAFYAVYLTRAGWAVDDGRQPPVWVSSLLVAVLGSAMATLVGTLRRRGERRVARERSLRRRQAELEQVKSNFLNVASHELRSPIAVARGYASMLADGSFGPLDAADVRRAAPVLRAKLDEMNALVDSMLDAARLEERRLVLQCATFDLRDLVSAAVQSVLPSLTPRHRVTWEPPRAPILVEADRTRLTIVLTNLLLNAIKYSPDGGPVAVFLTEDRGCAVVTVWDHGLGIAAADMERLFTRFGRIVTPENSHILGTGLGLYLARELARLHGGDILVQSVPGRGSAFSLVLPLAEPTDAADVEPLREGALLGTPPPPRPVRSERDPAPEVRGRATFRRSPS